MFAHTLQGECLHVRDLARHKKLKCVDAAQIDLQLAGVAHASSVRYLGSFTRNAYKLSPAATSTYCRPSSIYEIGPPVGAAINVVCQRIFPLAASNATRFDPLLVNNSRPAVDRLFVMPLPLGHSCFHRGLPV